MGSMISFEHQKEYVVCLWSTYLYADPTVVVVDLGLDVVLLPDHRQEVTCEAYCMPDVVTTPAPLPRLERITIIEKSCNNNCLKQISFSDFLYFNMENT